MTKNRNEASRRTVRSDALFALKQPATWGVATFFGGLNGALISPYTAYPWLWIVFALVGLLGVGLLFKQDWS